ncbi:MAG: hypothetical protein ABIF40_00550 [archaeon]
MKKCLLLVFIILFCPLVNAICTGDIAVIEDWDDVDWFCIPAESIPYIDAENLEYNELNADQRFRMTSNQIAVNLDEIENLAVDLDPKRVAKAVEDIYDVKFENDGYNFSLKSGILSFDEGSWVSLESLPENTEIGISSGGELLVYDLDIYPSEGSYLIAQNELNEVELPNGEKVLLKYHLGYDEGRLFIPTSTITEINGLELDLNPIELDLYFDEEAHDGNYIKFSEGSQKFSFADGKNLTKSLIVYFNEDNDIFDIKEDDLIFLMDSGSILELIDRGDKTVPLMMFTPGETGEELKFENGDSMYSLTKDGEFNKYGLIWDKTSTPFSLALADEDGNNILGTDEPQRIIFDDSHNFVIVPENVAEDLECKACTRDLSKNKVLLSYVTNELSEEGLDFNYARRDPTVLANFLNEYNTWSEEVQDSVNRLKIVSPLVLADYCNSENALACASRSTNNIFVKETTQPSALRHEVSHTRTFDLVNGEALEFEKEWKVYTLQLWKKHEASELPVYAQIDDGEGGSYFAVTWPGVQLSNEEREELLRLCTEADVKTADKFISKWKTVAGDVYGKDLGFGYVQDLSVLWQDGTHGPRHGCVRAYGCNNEMEDIATFTEQLAEKDYDFYRGLIDSCNNRENYEIYRNKIELLHEYKFMTDDEYYSITDGISTGACNDMWSSLFSE